MFQKGVPRLLMNEPVSSKRVKRHCMNFTIALASLPFPYIIVRFRIHGTSTPLSPGVGCFFLTLQDYNPYLVASLSIMAYSKPRFVNDKSCHKLADKVKC